MIDYGAVMRRSGITPLGVVHVGAFDGAEDINYRALGFKDRLFVEAQPDTFATLTENLAGSGAYCENLALSDRNGTADFHKATFAQSSSLLELGKHLAVYPGIVDAGTIPVKTMRLDDLLGLPAYHDISFNFLNIDIQGAELLCLGGACSVLRKFDLLNLEVNFDSLYVGAAHVSQIDAFLSAFDFIRIDTVLAHPTWGDAIYIRSKFTKVSGSQVE